MSLNPVMLAVRFLLELAALGCYLVYGWREFTGPWRFVAAVALPVAAALLWGIFTVPGDPSRHPDATVAVPGTVRLVIELLVLGGGAVALWLTGLDGWAIGFGAVLVIHLALGWDRFGWLLSH